MGIWAAFLLQGPHSAVGRVGPLWGEDNEQKVLLIPRPGRASLSYNYGVVQLSSHVPKKKSPNSSTPPRFVRQIVAYPLTCPLFLQTQLGAFWFWKDFLGIRRV